MFSETLEGCIEKVETGGYRCTKLIRAKRVVVFKLSGTPALEIAGNKRAVARHLLEGCGVLQSANSRTQNSVELIRFMACLAKIGRNECAHLAQRAHSVKFFSCPVRLRADHRLLAVKRR